MTRTGRCTRALNWAVAAKSACRRLTSTSCKTQLSPRTTDADFPAFGRRQSTRGGFERHIDRCLKQGTTIRIARVAGALKAGRDIKAEIAKGGTIILRHTLSERQIDVLMDGGTINWHKRYSTTNCR